MKIKFYVIIVFSLLLSACKEESGMVKDATVFLKKDFKQIEYLKGEIMEVDSLWKPIRIWAYDSSLFREIQ